MEILPAGSRLGHRLQIVRLGQGQPVRLALGPGHDLMEPPDRVRRLAITPSAGILLQQVERLKTDEHLGKGLEFGG